MELKDAIKFEDLLKGPVTFKVDLLQHANIGEEEGLAEDDDVVDAPAAQSTPWMASFDDLRRNMVQVPQTHGKIFKRIIDNGTGEPMGRKRCHIQWTYSLFYEKEQTSFDSSHYDTSSIATVKNENLMVGLILAVATMRKRESAEFVIHHDLMYGKNGILCDDEIYHRRACADILVCAKLVSTHSRSCPIHRSIKFLNCVSLFFCVFTA